MRCQTWTRWICWIVALSLFGLALVVYASRMAPSVVPGDPGEYQIIAARWGIGHPPGYGFYALLGNVSTHLTPWGTFAWRANFLSAVCGAAIVALAYGIGRTWIDDRYPAASLHAQVPPVLGAAVLAAGLDLWEHAIHANAHIVTAFLATCSLFCLLRWWRTDRDRWLFLFCFVAGVSPVQHPLLVFAFPAYAVFVLVVRPRIVREWQTNLVMVGCALAGLSAFLYYPIRSALGPPPAPGPTDMDTWAGFVRIVTAQGLRGNLGGFSVGDVLLRLWDVRVPLGLQYTLPSLALAAVGLAALWLRRWRAALLLTGFVGCVIFVTVNVLQDAMAYLLGPVVVVGVFAGAGVAELLQWGERFLQRRWAWAVVLALLAVLPAWSVVVNASRMDLSDWYDADDWLRRVESRFEGQGAGAILLTEWERMTTVYYYAAVEGREWNAQDLQFVHVYAGPEAPFLQAVDEHRAQGPVYMTTYRPEVADKYRLVPSGDLWQVLPAWPTSLPEGVDSAQISAEGRFEIVGWRLSASRAVPGQVLFLDLYMRMPDPEGVTAQQYYLPWAKLGDTTYRFTTDRRFSTPWWQPGEIVVERFDLPVPWRISSGRYPLQVGVQSITENRDLALGSGDTLATLADVQVGSATWRPSDRMLDRALGNLHGEILLRKAHVDGQRVTPDRADIEIHPGQKLRVLLEWESLRPIEENYKVFVQLLDAGLQVRAQGDDKAPLRGSAPTLLWFPRWRRGTAFADSYELDVPPDLPPGRYPLVTGMYGFTTFKRVQVASPDGDVAGDWITLAYLVVE